MLKKVLLIAVIMILITSSLYSENFWVATNGPYGAEINSIKYNANDNVLFVATRNDGVYKSISAGNLWQSFNNGELDNHAFVNDILISNSGEVFAITDSSGILKINEGSTWTEVNSGFGGHLRFSSMIQISNDEYLVGAKGKAVFKTTNGGENWLNYNAGLNIDENVLCLLKTDNAIFLGSDRGLFKSIDDGKKWFLVDDRIGKVNTIFQYNDSILYLGSSKGFYKSDISGITWINLSEKTASIDVTSITSKDEMVIIGSNDGLWKLEKPNKLTKLEAQLPTDNIKSLGYFNGTLFIGINQGIITFENNGIKYKINGLGRITTNDFVNVGNSVLCATNNGVYITDYEGFEWNPNNYGFSDNLNIKSLFRVNDSTILAGTSGDGLYYSTNNANRWTKNNNPELTSIFINDIIGDSAGNIYAGTIGKGIYKSSDGGMTWIRQYGDAIDNKNITSMAVITDNIIYAGTSQNGMFVKSNVGDWRKVDNFPVGASQILDIEFIRESQDIIIVSTNFGIVLSYSNGSQWINANSNLQSSAKVVYYGPDSTLYSGLKLIRGVFESIDFGNTWSYFPDNSGLYNEEIYSFFSSNRGFMYAGTQEGVIYRSKLPHKELPRVEPVIQVVGETSFCDGGFTVLAAQDGFFDYHWSNDVKSKNDTVWQSGSYWYSAKDSLGLLVYSDTTDITVFEKPVKPKILFNGKTVFCSIDANSYRWYYENELIPNSNYKSFDPDSNGWYKCEIFSVNNCSNISEEVYIELPIGIDYLDLSDEIKLFPNPTNGNLNLKSENLPIIFWEIMSITSIKLLDGQVNNKFLRIDLSDFKSGVYFLKLRLSNNQIIHYKIILLR